MLSQKPKVLVCVEGERTDVRLMKHLLSVFRIDVRYEIVSYNTNIYVLYGAMFAEGHPEDMDFLQVLKEREHDPAKRALLNETYSDILLVFDMDPQDPQFAPEKLQKMTDYFCESTDTGKLYINYPMVEAFYHMSDIPDPNFNSRYATLDELIKKAYKCRANQENRNRDYTKFAVEREECATVILQNLKKAWMLAGEGCDINYPSPEQQAVLNQQLKLLNSDKKVSVLCTCIFFIADYDMKLLNPALP